MKIIKVIILILGVVAFLSCSSAKHTRKCNGKKGVKVRMGTL